MIIRFEFSKILRNKAVLFSLVLILALIVIQAGRCTSEVTERFVDPEEASQAFFSFTAETEATAKNALRAASSNSYAAEYYSKVIEVYSTARQQVVFTEGDVSGFNELLTFDSPLYLCLLASLLFGAIGGYEDKRIGVASILSTAQKGRRTRSACQILSVAVLSALTAAVAALLSYVVFKASGLINNGDFALQSAPAFEHSPYLLSLRSAFLLIALRRCLVCAACAVFAFFLSKMLRGYIPIVLLSAVLPTLEYIVFSTRYTSVDVFVKNANIFSYGSSYLFQRLYIVRLFGAASPERIVFIFLVCFILLCGLLSVFLFQRYGGMQALRRKLSFPKLHFSFFKARAHSLFTWEAGKLIITPVILLPVICCLVLGIVGIYSDLPVKKNAGEELYRSYCEEYSKKSLIEVRGALADEQEKILEGRALGDLADRLRAEGKIDSERYNEMMQEYFKSFLREGQMPALSEKFDYLIRTSAEYKTEMRFLYDTGVKKLFSTDLNIYMAVCILLLSCLPFYKERESGFYSLLHTLKNGRRKVLASRLGFVCVCTFGIVLLFSAAPLSALASSGIFEHPDAPAASIAILHDAGTIPLGLLIAEVCVMRLIAAECVAILTFSLSVFMERFIVVILPVGGWLALSYVARNFGLSFLPIDLSAFFSGNVAMMSVGQSAWLCMIPLLLLTVIVALLCCKRINGKIS